MNWSSKEASKIVNTTKSKYLLHKCISVFTLSFSGILFHSGWNGWLTGCLFSYCKGMPEVILTWSNRWESLVCPSVFPTSWHMYDMWLWYRMKLVLLTGLPILHSCLCQVFSRMGMSLSPSDGKPIFAVPCTACLMLRNWHPPQTEKGVMPAEHIVSCAPMRFSLL